MKHRVSHSSITAADNIINHLSNHIFNTRRLNLFNEFAITMVRDRGLETLTNLHAACELVNDYLNNLKSIDQSNDSDYVKKTQKMELRANLSRELQKCGLIGEFLNNNKILGGKYAVNNLNKINNKLISMIFNLRNTVYSEKKQDKNLNQVQLSEITKLIERKEYDLAIQWSKPGQVDMDLLKKAKPELDNPVLSQTTTTTTTTGPTPVPLAPTPQPTSTKKSFTIFFLGTGERFEEDTSKGKKYKYTLLTEFQKAIPDSVLERGIGAGYGDYDKAGDTIVKRKRGFLGQMILETVGGEGHEASIRAARSDLDEFLQKNNIDPHNTDIEINLVGFSRGAITCNRFANRLRFIYPNLKVNIFDIDPVPGPVSKLTDDWEARNIPPTVGEYHAVHMQHVGGSGNAAYTIGFDPEDFSRLTPEDPNSLVFSVDILPGSHGGAQIVRGNGMEDPTLITAYNLHKFLERHGATIPAQSINLPNEDRVTWSNFDYLTICSDPKERLKMFENMVNNEPLYSKHGSKIRMVNKETYRYHQNSDYFLTQQHREDFKAVYPNIFYWFFEGGKKDQKISISIKDNVINEISNLDGVEDSRLINYLLSKNVNISAQEIKIPPLPIGNEEFPIENSPYTNHQTLSGNQWVYYHSENGLLRNQPVSERDLAHFIRELDLDSIITKLQKKLLAFLYLPNPTGLLVDQEKKPFHKQHIKLANDLLNGLTLLAARLDHYSKEEAVNRLMLLLNATIVEDCNIHSRRGGHHLTKMCWEIIEDNGLQTILDKYVREYIQQKIFSNQQDQQTTASTTTTTPTDITNLNNVDTNESEFGNSVEEPVAISQPSSLFWNRGVPPEKIELGTIEEEEEQEELQESKSSGHLK
jgi:hypothetical protein